jgi:hypothetical protein
MQYVISDPSTGRCALVDPVLDYDEKSGATATSSADALLAFVRERNLTVEWILDTQSPCGSLFRSRVSQGEDGREGGDRRARHGRAATLEGDL